MVEIGFFENLMAFWNSLEWYAQLMLGIMIFFIIAGITGLDGGDPKWPLKKKEYEEVTSSSNPRVYMEISIDGKQVPGRMIIEVFKNFCPKTAENFKCLCTGEKGMGKHKKKLHYKGHGFHRIIANFMCQGGDITKGDGTGGESIYETTHFDDEFMETMTYMPHNKVGLLSMANSGKHTNSSQFFIITKPTPWLDKRHVVFGFVEDGMDILMKMNEVAGTGMNGEPTKKVVITDCGLVDKKKQ